MFSAPMIYPNPSDLALATGFGSSSGGKGYLIFIIAVLAFGFVRRIYAAARGLAFRRSRVIRLPIMYILITLLLVVPLEITDRVALLTLLGAVPGLGVGYIFGKGVSFFQRNGMTYYKRSPVVMTIWLVSLVARVIIYFEFPQDLSLALLTDVLLSFTAGMLMGEAVHILRGHSEYTSPDKPDSGDADYVREM